ncbi:hypothetical protein SAMD00024442_23_9 [Candidatus Symbiothrix dinenymphae]|nr:hypothetical protein SAMD00024442_23_9 [Candidatus Symbiothrix dinenymphae]
MKRILFLVAIASIAGGCNEDTPTAIVLPGSIQGKITDIKTRSVIPAADIILELGELTLHTTTDSKGIYQFDELSQSGRGGLHITARSYADIANYDVVVKADTTTTCNVEMSPQEEAMRVVDIEDVKKNVTELDFGNTVETQEFNIVNESTKKFEWEIINSTKKPWVSIISMERGTLAPAASQPIVITIDRSQLDPGENTTYIYVVSYEASGIKKLLLRATRL